MTFKQAKIDNHRTLYTVDVNFTMDINKKHRKKGTVYYKKTRLTKTVNFTIYKKSHYKVIVYANNEKKAKEIIATIKEKLTMAKIPGLSIYN